jgi:transcriptional regulator with PAS, ATPase and Fis domain
VRELEAAIERAVHALEPGGRITEASLGDPFLLAALPFVREHGESLRGRRMELEANLIRAAIARAGGNRTRAARSLGMTRQGLWKKMRRLSREGSPALADQADPASGLLDPESP